MIDKEPRPAELVAQLKARGLSSRKIARLMGVNPSTICRIQTGKGIRLETYIKLMCVGGAHGL